MQNRFHKVRMVNVTKINMRLFDSPFLSVLESASSHGTTFWGVLSFYWRKPKCSRILAVRVVFYDAQTINFPQTSATRFPLHYRSYFTASSHDFVLGFSFFSDKTCTGRVLTLKIVFYNLRTANRQHRQDFATEESQIVGQYERLIFHLSPNFIMPITASIADRQLNNKKNP